MEFQISSSSSFESSFELLGVLRNNFAPYVHIICMLINIIQLDKFYISSTGTRQLKFIEYRYSMIFISIIQLNEFYYYGRPVSVSGRPCCILPMFFLFFYGRLIFRPWLTEIRESFTRGGP